MNTTTVPTAMVKPSITGAIDKVGPVQGELANGATTDDTRPTFHGLGNPGELVNLTAVAIGANGKPSGVVLDLGKAVVQADGFWSFTSGIPLNMGSYDVHVGQGTQGAPFHLTIDTTPSMPQVSATVILGAIDDSGATVEKLANGANTHDATPTLFGTGQPGEVLHLSAAQLNKDGSFVGYLSLGETQVKADGTWQLTTPQLPQSGLYTFQVDGSSAQGSLTLTYSNPAEPVPAHQEPVITGAFDDYGPVQGELNNGATTDDIRPALHGIGTPGELVMVSAVAIDANGKPSNVTLGLGQALVQADGTWHFVTPQPLSNGTYDFHVGQGTGGDAFRLVIDNSFVAPVPVPQPEPEPQPQPQPEPHPVVSDAVITGAVDHFGPVTGELANGATTDDIRPMFHGTGTPGDMIMINAVAIDAHGKPSNITLVLGQTLVQPDGTWHFVTPQPLSNGTYDFRVGQGTEGEAFRLVVDNSFVAPVPVPQPEPQPEPQPQPQPQPEPHPVVSDAVITGAVDHFGPVTGELANGATTDDIRPMLHGTGTPGEMLMINAVAIDAHGNPSNVTLVLGQTLVQPDGTWHFVTPQPLSNGTYDFHVGQGAEGEAFRLVVDNSFVAPEPMPQPEPQPEPHPGMINAVITGAIDHVGPVTGELGNHATTDDSRPTFHGFGNAGEVLALTAIGIGANGQPSGVIVKLGDALVQADGSWSFTSKFPLSVGSYDIHVGNGPQVEPFRITYEDGHMAQQQPLVLNAQQSDSWIAGDSHGELQLTLKSGATEQPQSNASLPQLGNVLEMDAGQLQWGAQQNTHEGQFAHSGAQFDMRPAMLEELNTFNAHVV
ncbi:hypothetical protein [Pseudomonas nicosulfuronedens]